jgi:hypothetical protein
VTRAILCLLLFAVPVLSTGQSDARVIKPEIRVGDSWTYRSTNVLGPGTDEHVTRVSFADDKVILAVSTRKSDGKEFDSSWTSEWNAITSYTGLMYRPPTGVLRFPLRVGDKYAIKFEILRLRGSNVMQNATGTAMITGWETVDVPAGKFRAMRVDVEAVYRNTDGSGAFVQQATFWYVPEVRRWVKLQSVFPGRRLSEELLEYKLNEN